jgi:hypothetical protein
MGLYLIVACFNIGTLHLTTKNNGDDNNDNDINLLKLYYVKWQRNSHDKFDLEITHEREELSPLPNSQSRLHNRRYGTVKIIHYIPRVQQYETASHISFSLCRDSEQSPHNATNINITRNSMQNPIIKINSKV